MDEAYEASSVYVSVTRAKFITRSRGNRFDGSRKHRPVLARGRVVATAISTQAEKRSNRYEAFIHDTPIQRPLLPWTPESIVSEQELPKKRIWSHTLYAHLYDSRLVAEKLDAMYGADQGYQEPKFRESAVFAAKFTAGDDWSMTVSFYQAKRGFLGGC
ncbi:hypothetical protein PUV44_24010 [Xanthomonas arboricola pv. corylina]|nr:hypothetical protein PUV44_24010 [Xanthomonas arboricola pv. corylina]